KAPSPQTEMQGLDGAAMAAPRTPATPSPSRQSPSNRSGNENSSDGKTAATSCDALPRRLPESHHLGGLCRFHERRVGDGSAWYQCGSRQPSTPPILSANVGRRRAMPYVQLALELCEY